MENHDALNKPVNRAERMQSAVLMYLHDFVTWLVVILLAFLLLFRVVVVSGPSMKNTLLHGDYLLLINNVFYKEPAQGDIIVVGKDCELREGGRLADISATLLDIMNLEKPAQMSGESLIK